MDTPRKSKPTTLGQERIDQLVVSQASDESAWEAPVPVKRLQTGRPLPGELTARSNHLSEDGFPEAAPRIPAPTFARPSPPLLY
jgi:hypothetical protein